MESLGFTDAVSEWSDGPRPSPSRPPGRHVSTLAPAVAPASVADWAPGEIRHELDRRNVRWNVLISVAVLVGALSYVGFWLYQRPTAQANVAAVEMETQAAALADTLPVLEDFNDALLLPDAAAEPPQLFELESAARLLFQTSGQLPPEQEAARSAASVAAEEALEGLQLVRGGHAYRLAVTPILARPDLETDPNLIALDEAARAFGEWQLQFDQVRTALPDQVLPDVTERMDLVSAELGGILTGYVDALRSDDMAAAQAVLSGLDNLLNELSDFMDVELDAVQSQVSRHIAEAENALADLDA